MQKNWFDSFACKQAVVRAPNQNNLGEAGSRLQHSSEKVFVGCSGSLLLPFLEKRKSQANKNAEKEQERVIVAEDIPGNKGQRTDVPFPVGCNRWMNS